MAEIRPFRGFVYNIEKIKNILDVIAPPYDVISKSEQNKLYRRSPYNIIRLILGKQYETDNSSRNRYTRASQNYNQWQKEGVLLREDFPTIYIYSQTYYITSRNQSFTRQGFLALLRLADVTEKMVFYHEKTLSKPLQDRIELMKTCRANFSPLFMLYNDPRHSVMAVLNNEVQKPPYLDFTDDESMYHRLWKIDTSSTISKLIKLMKSKKLIIADGHHRYKAALRYRDYLRNRSKEELPHDHPSNYALVYFTNLFDPGLLILPTHRLIHNLPNFNPSFLLSKLIELFEVETIEYTQSKRSWYLNQFQYKLKKESSGGKNIVIGMHISGENKLYILCARKNIIRQQMNQTDVSDPLKRVDIVVLHRIILERLLKISTAVQKKQKNIIYVKGNEELSQVLKRYKYQCAFILNPLPTQLIKNISYSGEVFPQKSTFFYPKLPSGLVINPLQE